MTCAGDVIVPPAADIEQHVLETDYDMEQDALDLVAASTADDFDGDDRAMRLWRCELLAAAARGDQETFAELVTIDTYCTR